MYRSYARVWFIDPFSPAQRESSTPSPATSDEFLACVMIIAFPDPPYPGRGQDTEVLADGL